MALDPKELTRIIKEELEKLGEIESIGYIEDESMDPNAPVLGVTTIDGRDLFITTEYA